jgi:hypothetical protein
LPATPYKATSWSGDEPIYKDKLNQMTNNDQWLYENTPRMSFNTYGIKRTNGIKIMAAICVVPTNKSANSTATFEFGTFFSSGCKPVIVTGTQPTSGRGRLHCMIRGISSNYPDHRGFKATVSADEIGGTNNVIDAKVYVHFVAIGW